MNTNAENLAHAQHCLKRATEEGRTAHAEHWARKVDWYERVRDGKVAK